MLVSLALRPVPLPWKAPAPGRWKWKRVNVHRRRTPRHLPPLLETVELAAAVRLGLALHKVVVEGLAPVADEVRRAGQRRRRRANLGHARDVRRHGRGVHEDLLVEPGLVSNADSGCLSGPLSCAALCRHSHVLPRDRR